MNCPLKNVADRGHLLAHTEGSTSGQVRLNSVGLLERRLFKNVMGVRGTDVPIIFPVAQMDANIKLMFTFLSIDFVLLSVTLSYFQM